MNAEELKMKIDNGCFDKQFELLYAEVTSETKMRYRKAVDEFVSIFGDSDELRLLSVPGRSEVGGNHTDHNNGRVIACAVNLDIIAVVAPNAKNTINIKSEGFDMDSVKLSKLEPDENEKGRSSALIRGVAAHLCELGFKVDGFNAYTTSKVLKGSGLSSSAAFEVMTANIISCLFNNEKIDPVTMAKTGQYAEGKYFGKPCGLMDQTACAVGGFITIDFKDTENPVIEKLDFDFVKTGFSLCIVDTAGDHADLSDDYAAIRSEMTSVAGLLGGKVLRDCDEMKFYANLPKIRAELGDRAALRAMHFFGDNARVVDEVTALKNADFRAFLDCVIASGRSSYMYLQNIYSLKYPDRQGLGLALALAEKILADEGAWRVHGGGFAGTIEAFVPHEKLAEFESIMNKVFGKSACHKLTVRPVGAYCFK